MLPKEEQVKQIGTLRKSAMLPVVHGGGGSVSLRESIDYEVEEYQDADVYEIPK